MPEPRRHGNHRAEPEESEAGLPDGWMEWGGESAFDAEQRARPGEGPVDDRDVPF